MIIKICLLSLKKVLVWMINYMVILQKILIKYFVSDSVPGDPEIIRICCCHLIKMLRS